MMFRAFLALLLCVSVLLSGCMTTGTLIFRPERGSAGNTAVQAVGWTLDAATAVGTIVQPWLKEESELSPEEAKMRILLPMFSFTFPILFILIALPDYLIANAIPRKGDKEKQEEKDYVPIANEELYGTWTNTAYTDFPQKLVITEGALKEYQNMSDEFAAVTRPATLLEKWHDGEYIRYKIQHDDKFFLSKISYNGTVLEFVSSFEDFPDIIDKKSETYRIYYWQK